MKTLRVTGIDITSTANQSLESDYNQISQTISCIEDQRGSTKAGTIQIDTADDDLVILQFEDGGEWIGPVDELGQIFGQSSTTRGGDQLLEIPTTLHAVGKIEDRGLFTGIKLKLIRLVTRKAADKVIKTTAQTLGLKADQYVMNKPGLYRVTGKSTAPFNPGTATPGHYLLFLHGTLSSYLGSFGDLFDFDSTGIREVLTTKYGDHMLALDHYTLTQSPFHNAIEVLNNLPAGSTLDLITQSRGGLIGDILASCDHRMLDRQPEVYPLQFILDARDQGHTSLADEMETLNQLAVVKKIEVHKIIRVACPAAGTVLLDSRMDKLLNAILNALGLATGWSATGLYAFLKGFITDVVRARAESEALPGLLSMIPESFPQHLVNRNDVSLPGRLIVIEGDAESGKNLKHSVQVILFNLYFREANDFVVHTASMRSGMLREQGLFVLLTQDIDTNHFRYFKNKKSQQGIVDAVQAPDDTIAIPGFDFIGRGDSERGIVFGLFKSYKPFRAEHISGDKPILLLIPGIMGTHLSVDGSPVWLNLFEIGKGRMLELDPTIHPMAGTDYVIGNYYEDLAKYLAPDFDVVTFGYDWRLSLHQAALQLKQKLDELVAYNKPIQIIAHSMGGLVVRDLIRLHPDTWSAYNKLPEFKVILLGTPWLGSHLIIEAFTGYLKMVRQIRTLAFPQSQRKLLKLYHQFEGMYQLLPINEEAWEDPKTWIGIKEALVREKFEVPDKLQTFGTYKRQIQQWNPTDELQQVYYIAGKADCTTTRLEVVKNKLQFFGTPEGDGSVTWALGIPKSLDPKHLYYAHDTRHGDLASDTALFAGISELLKTGSCTGKNLYDYPPSVSQQRGSADADGLIPVIQEPVSNRAEEILNNILDRPVRRKSVSVARDVLDISVIHGDLMYARYPVMVGHIFKDGITGAETAIDEFYYGRLRERHAVGNYPGKVGESLILFDPDNEPNGAIIIGLGEVNEFNAYRLSKAVEAGVINYAMHMRDNVNDRWLDAETKLDRNSIETSISCLCIGTGYGRIPMGDSLKSIIIGVDRANETLGQLKGLEDKKIRTIEFIEIYEHIAQNMYAQLTQLKKNPDKRIRFNLKKGIQPKFGARKKVEFIQDNSWWHIFDTQLIDKARNLPRLQFISSSGIARIELQNTFTPPEVIKSLLASLMMDSKWDENYSKTLFELLIPYQFKDIIRQHNNIIWKMDIDAAAYPWEMFHEPEQGNEPTFVNAGLIRQLISTNARMRSNIVRSNTALVIGDPDYTGKDLPQLPGALAEARAVNELIKSYSEFTTTFLPNKKGNEILKNLCCEEYKILHIAGHGLISDRPGETGIALDGKMMILPGMFTNFSRLPEFVFINCCNSGTIIPGKEKYYEKRYEFAANIGTELIRLGVNAVVVAGWPVNDTGAMVFAKTLYTQLLEGVRFGDAVRIARKACYAKDPANNTWGAYQCYGDPWYQLVLKSQGSGDGKEYISEEEVLADLYNLKSETELLDPKMTSPAKIKDKLTSVLDRSRKDGFDSGKVLEFEAMILSELDELEASIDRLEKLRKKNKADYSIRSIEQFCNLRMKKLLRTKVDPKTKKGLPELRAAMKQIEADFQYLLLIGETPERLSLLGSAYKKLASLSIRHKIADRKKLLAADYLRQAEAYYKAAFRMMDPSGLAASIYPLTNWLIIYGINTMESTATVSGTQPVKVSTYLDQVAKDLRGSYGRNIDFWEDISMVNVLQAKLFFTDSPEEVTQIGQTIIHHYLHAWKMGGTLKNLQTEIEQMEWIGDGLEVMSGADKEWLKVMRKVVVDVKKALVGLQ